MGSCPRSSHRPHLAVIPGHWAVGRKGLNFPPETRCCPVPVEKSHFQSPVTHPLDPIDRYCCPDRYLVVPAVAVRVRIH